MGLLGGGLRRRHQSTESLTQRVLPHFSASRPPPGPGPLKAIISFPRSAQALARFGARSRGPGEQLRLSSNRQNHEETQPRGTRSLNTIQYVRRRICRDWLSRCRVAQWKREPRLDGGPVKPGSHRKPMRKTKRKNRFSRARAFSHMVPSPLLPATNKIALRRSV